MFLPYECHDIENYLNRVVCSRCVLIKLFLGGRSSDKNFDYILTVAQDVFRLDSDDSLHREKN